MKMMLVKCWFLLLAIPVIEGSLRLGKPQGLPVEERVMKKIQGTCYGDNDFNDVIFILGDFYEVFDKASVIQISNLLNVDEEYESRQLLSIGVTKVVIIEDSPERLHSELMSFKKTRWWNNMLPFFIIGKNDEKCENFNEILNTTWRMEILNSIYICSESENTTLYTLNPITNYAPNPWKRIKDLNDSNIYHQIFDPHTSCNNLNYDKTKVLNCYPIQFIQSVPPYDEIDVSSIPDPSALFVLNCFITDQLNANVKFNIIHRNDPKRQLEGSKADVIFYELTTAEATKFTPLYIRPLIPCVALVKTTERTVLHKIRHLWNLQVLCVSVISFIILYFILKMKNDDFTSAILEIIRYFTYTSIRTDTRSNSFRIYFTTMLIFIVITNGIFQGEIAAFSMKLDKVPPIKTMKELNDLGYHFSVDASCMRMLSGLHLSESNVTVIRNISNIAHPCPDFELDETLNACIIPLYLYQYVHLPKHVSHIRPRDDILYPYSWIPRRDWPIHERFNFKLMQIFESGINTLRAHTLIHRMNDREKANEDELTLAGIRSPYQPIPLANLNLAFKFLGIGLYCAMFVLIVELRMREI